jgi:hypothetical protein
MQDVWHPSTTLAATSFAFGALTWLGVLVTYLWFATWPGDLLILLLALTAIVNGALAVIRRARSALAWSALAVSLIFPVWLWEQLSALPSDAF